jgi:peptidoglycan/LPS O-acetylase OafA/YrhL
VGLLAALWLLSMAAPIGYWVLDPDGLKSASVADETVWLGMVKFNPLIRLPEFLMGMVLGKLFLAKGSAEWFGRASGALALVASLALVVALCRSNVLPYVLLHNGLLSLIFALLIFSLAPGRGMLARLLSSPFCRLLGESSYSLYILHLPLAAWSSLLLRRLGLPFGDSGLAELLYMTGTVAVSIAVFKRIEEPARQWLRRGARSSRLAPSAAAGG